MITGKAYQTTFIMGLYRTKQFEVEKSKSLNLKSYYIFFVGFSSSFVKMSNVGLHES